MILTAQQILDTQKHRVETIDLGEGKEVLVRALPSHVVDNRLKAKDADAFIFIHAVVDEKGKRLFADEQLEEVTDTVSSDVLQLVASKALTLSIVSKERREEIKKNWKTLVEDASGESPSRSDTPTPT